MFHFQLKLVGSADSNTWTPSVTVYEEFEQVFCHVGNSLPMPEAIAQMLVIYDKCVAEFGVGLRLFQI